MQMKKINRLETTNRMGNLVDKHWGALRTAHENGEKTAWSVGTLFPFAQAVGIKSHHYAGYCAYIGGRKHAGAALELSESTMGYYPETCSYHRAHHGVAYMFANKIPVPKEMELPIPDVILTLRMCTEHSHLSDSFYRTWKDWGINVPVIGIDEVPPHREEDIELNLKFLKSSIREVLIPELEKISGRKFDYDEFAEIVAFLKETATLRNECCELMKHVPAPATIFDMSVSMAPTLYMISKELRAEALAYYRDLKKEMQDRIDRGVSAMVPKEEYRVFWDGFMVWGWVGVMARKLTSYGANGIIGRYAPMEMFPHPEELDPNRAVDSYTEQLTKYMCRSNTPEVGLGHIVDWCKDYSIDALIVHHSRTCRLWNLGQQDAMAEVQRKLGIPSVMIEADMIDPKFWSEAQIDTRLQALFETVDARRHKG